MLAKSKRFFLSLKNTFQTELQFFYRFFFFNACFLSLILFQYLWVQFPVHLIEGNQLGSVLLSLYNIAFYLMYIGVGCFLLLLTLCLPIVIALKRLPSLALIWSIGIGFSISAYFFTDSIVFSLFRFHLNTTLIKIILSPGVFPVLTLSQVEWLIISLILALLLSMQIIFVSVSWKKRHRALPPFAKYLKWGYLSSFILLYTLYFSGIETSSNALSQITKTLPYHNQIMSLLLFGSANKSALDLLKFGKFYQLNQTTSKADYPKHTLQCDHLPTKDKQNIILIVVDTWRFDALSREIMPNIFKLSLNATRFEQHYSGGNSTLAGLFSLFYSVPNNYWTSFLEQGIGPVLIDKLIENHYQLGIFSSATLKIPAYDKTLFVKLKDKIKDTPGNLPVERDKNVTQRFISFLNQLDPSKPFFGYLMYNMAHAYCTPQDFKPTFQPAITHCLRMNIRSKTQAQLYKNRYLNALHFIDQQLGKLISELQKNGRLQNTTLIITSDHGQQFNDNQLGYWEHASNYTNYQLHVPLLIISPTMKPKSIAYPTSHYDIVPTILKRLMACHNDPRDYSIGSDLFTPHPKDFLLAGSYVNFAIVEPNSITLLNPSGNFIVQDKKARTLQKKPNLKHIQKALRIMRNFYTDRRSDPSS